MHDECMSVCTQKYTIDQGHGKLDNQARNMALDKIPIGIQSLGVIGGLSFENSAFLYCVAKGTHKMCLKSPCTVV